MTTLIFILAGLNGALTAALLVQKLRGDRERKRLEDELVWENTLRGVESSVSQMITERRLYEKDLQIAKLRGALKASEEKRKELCKRLKEAEHVSN